MRCLDMFAGWGGFTLAAELAGCSVPFAANHWDLAVRAHAANHPETAHACQDLRQVDWSTMPAYDVLLAGPACPGHSPAARGARKRSGRVRRYHDGLRATAWAVVDCAEVTRPRAVIVENVPEFAAWSSDPRDPAKRGDLFAHWLDGLRLRGYRMHVGTLVASVHADVPQRRRRLFVVGVRGRERAAERRVLDLPASPEPAFGPCVDWRAGDWTRVRDATPNVQKRIARSRARHGSRFLTQHTRDHHGTPLSEPIRTITTKDQWAVVRGASYRPLTIRETARAMGFPDSYAWPEDATRGDTIRGLGNAVPPDLGRRVIERVAGLL